MTILSQRFYDSHAHLISDDLARYPRNPVPVSIEGIPKGSPFGPGTMGFPGGFHGDKPLNVKPTAEQLHAWMQEENVVGAAVVQKGLIYRTDNRYIVDAASLFPDDMCAVIIIDPMEEGTMDKIRQDAERGAVGVRFFPIDIKMDKIAWLSSEPSMAVWELCNDTGLIVDIESTGTDHDSVVPLIVRMANRFPKLRIVLDHVGLPAITQPNFGLSGAFNALRDVANVSVKWTSINLDMAFVRGIAPEELCRAVVDYFGADRTMWGSDIGTSSGSYREMCRRGLESTKLLTEEERGKVLHDTARRLFTTWTGD